MCRPQKIWERTTQILSAPVGLAAMSFPGWVVWIVNLMHIYAPWVAVLIVDSFTLIFVVFTVLLCLFYVCVRLRVWLSVRFLINKDSCIIKQETILRNDQILTDLSTFFTELCTIKQLFISLFVVFIVRKWRHKLRILLHKQFARKFNRSVVK